MENKDVIKEKLAALLHQTSEDHHTAFKETDGVDPDWSIWYTDHLLKNGIEEMLQAKFVKSDLIYLLVSMDKIQQKNAPGARWEYWYAASFVSRYLK